MAEAVAKPRVALSERPEGWSGARVMVLCQLPNLSDKMAFTPILVKTSTKPFSL
jgi:hypothetical protein